MPQASEPETCCHIASAERKLRSPWHFDIRCISTFCPPSASNILWVRAPLRFCSTSCCTLPKGETTEATKKIAKFVWLQTSPGLSECNLLRISLAQPDGVERMRALGKRGAVAASSFLCGRIVTTQVTHPPLLSTNAVPGEVVRTRSFESVKVRRFEVCKLRTLRVRQVQEFERLDTLACAWHASVRQTSNFSHSKTSPSQASKLLSSIRCFELKLQFEGLQVRKLKVVSFTCFKLDWQLTAEVESLTVPKFHSEVGSLRV